MRTEEFLKDYKQKTKFIADKFFIKWKKKAGKTNDLPLAMLDKFAKLFPRGKQFRGALMVLGYELVGGKKKKEIIKASVFLELFHTAILICDDVFDRDDTRRGLPAIHEQWEKKATSYPSNSALQKGGQAGKQLPVASKRHYGNSMAINTGIMGFYLAQIPLLSADFSESRKHQALLEFSRYVVRLVWGEAMDISTELLTRFDLYGNSNKRSDLYGIAEQIHQLKTVEYTGIMPLKIGAILAGASDKMLSLLEKYGQVLGQIFQIQDDIIGSFGNSTISGKANDSDIKQARWTILVEILMAEAGENDRKEIKKIYGKEKRKINDVKKIKELMVKYRIVQKAQKKAGGYLKKGLAVVNMITDDPGQQDTLKNLLEFMIERTK